jgi:hypothetical protein
MGEREEGVERIVIEAQVARKTEWQTDREKIRQIATHIQTYRDTER